MSGRLPVSEVARYLDYSAAVAKGSLDKGSLAGPVLGRIIERIIDRRRGAVRRLVAVVDLGELLPRLLGFALPVPHTGIEPAGRQKPGVGAALGDAPLIQHDNFIGADDGRQPVRDHQRGAAARDALQRFLDFMLGVAVERGRRLIQHQDRRRLQHRARNCHALLLAARQFQAAFADLGFVALRRHADEAVDLRQLRRLLPPRHRRRPSGRSGCCSGWCR